MAAIESWDGERRAQLRLALTPGVGPRTRLALIARFGAARGVLAASASELKKVSGVGEKLALRIKRSNDDAELDSLLARCAQDGVSIAMPEDPRFPKMLGTIDDPPGVLFVRGEVSDKDSRAIAVVGSRRASHYGRGQAFRFGYSLAKAGWTVVSGLARGVDVKAHLGALEAGGRTLAVLGGGVANIYPPEHAPLAQRVAQAGALISEAPPWNPPYSGSFPQRNRLITGLARALLVVEATERSGALISARHAMEQNRDVFALPGRIDSPVSVGCHQLLKDGAGLATCAEDILDELGPPPESVVSSGMASPNLHPPTHRDPSGLSPDQRAVLEAIGPDGEFIDTLIDKTGKSASAVLVAISALELGRWLRRVGGQRVERCELG